MRSLVLTHWMSNVTSSRPHLISLAVLAVLLAACSGELNSPAPLPAAGSAQPHLSAGPGDSVVLSWLEPAAAGVALRFSTFDGRSWSSPTTVAEGDDWFINWADFPSVSPIKDSVWAAHWLVKKPGGIYVYDVYASISGDSGRTWNEPFVVHNDNTASEHGFVSLFPWEEDIGILWLDGRNTQPGGGGHHSHTGGMTLRSARFSSDGTAAQRVEVDDLVCDCCPTDVTISSKGPVAVYRDRTQNEIRDISVTRMVDGSWSAGVPVADDGWEISGCPVNGPAIDSFDNHVVAAWFTAANDRPAVRLAFSADNGTTFDAPLDIDLDSPLGRVDVVQLAEGSSVVSWLASGEEGAASIVARYVGADGRLGDEIAVASTGVGRTSGMPQMIRSGESLLFAWTDVHEEETQVQTKLIPIEEIR